jgi:membrane-bound metal-dependent hydrolase YbcI (DUF457 family)
MLVLLFCHLLIGTALGLLVYRRIGSRIVVPVAALGAILPDIVDKPLGHLLLQGTLDSGRIYAHTLLFLGLVTVAGVVAWRYKLTPLVLVAAMGVASHLVLDTMWDNPVTLLWPALGPFVPYHYPGYFANMFVEEIASPLEWLSGAAFLIVLTALYREMLGTLGGLVERTHAVRLPLFLLTAVAGVVSIMALAYYPVNDAELSVRLMAGACAMVAGGFLFSREKKDALLEGPRPKEEKQTL